MGNVLEGVQASGDVRQEDLKWLATTNDCLFNEGFLAEVFDSLAKPIESKKTSTFVEDEKGSIYETSVKAQHLRDIFSNISYGELDRTLVDSIPSLGKMDSSVSNYNAMSLERRGRVVERVHLGLVREIMRIAESNHFSEGQKDSVFKWGKGDGHKVLEEDNASDLLTGTSIRMSLAIMKCLEYDHSELFVSVAESLIDLIKRSSTLAFANISPESANGNTIQAIMDYAEKVAESQKGGRSLALGLMLAVSISSGSLRNVLSVVSHLQQGVDALPESAECFCDRLLDMKTELELTIPDASSIVSQFKVKQNSVKGSKLGDDLQSICTDGIYMYIWDSIRGTISKVGTGFHGTIAGSEYDESLEGDIEEKIRSFLGDNVPGDVVKDPLDKSTCMIKIIEDNVETYLEDTDGGKLMLDSKLLSAGEVYPVLGLKYFHLDAARPCFRIACDGDTNCWIHAISPHDEAVPVGELSCENGNDVEYPLVFHDHDAEDKIFTETLYGASDTAAGSEAESKDSSQGRGWIVYGNGMIYLRMTNTLGPVHMAMISPLTLKVERVVPVDFDIASIVKARKLLYGAVNEGDSSSRAPVEEEVDQEDEWIEGGIVNYATLKYGADFVSFSGSSADAFEEEMQLSLREDDTSADVENCLFLQNDAEPESPLHFTIDLGEGRFNLREIGGEFRGDGDWDGGFKIEVSEDGSSYSFWNAVSSSLGDSESIRSHSDAESDFIESEDDYSTDEDDDEDYDDDEDDEDHNRRRRRRSRAEGRRNNSDAISIIRKIVKSESYGGPAVIRYLRFTFNGNADIIYVGRVYAAGNIRMKRSNMAAFPAVASDGRYLYAVHSHCISVGSKSDEEGSPIPSYNVCVKAVDPLCGFRVMSTTKLIGCELTEYQLLNCSLLCNGERLIIMHDVNFGNKRTGNEEKVNYCFYYYNLLNGKLLKEVSNEVEKTCFVKKTHKGFPNVACYDVRNNFSWSFDVVNCSVLRWRSRGLPVTSQSVPCSLSEGASLDDLLSLPVKERVSLLRGMIKWNDEKANTDVNAHYQAVYLVSLLEKLGEVHGSPMLPMAESNYASEVVVMSAGLYDGNNCRIDVRGENVATNHKGFNIVVLGPRQEVLESKSFDTADSSTASDRMADFIDRIPDGRVVLVAVCKSAKEKLTSRGIAALSDLGANHLEMLRNSGSFALIGKKGAQVGTVPQCITDSRKGKAICSCQLPPPVIPLAVEIKSDTMKYLVKMIVYNYHQYWAYSENSKTASESNRSLVQLCLLSLLNVLNTNVYQLMRGISAKESTLVFDEYDRKSIRELVNEILNNSSDETKCHAAISQAALRVFLTSIDLLYSKPEDKCALLVHYLNRFSAGSLSVVERSVLELLLMRLSSPSSLMSLSQGSMNSLAKEAAVGGSTAFSSSRIKLPPVSLFSSLLAIVEQEACDRLSCLCNPKRSKLIAISTNLAADVGVASTEMLSSLYRLMYSSCGHSLFGSNVDKFNFVKDSSYSSCFDVFCDLCCVCSNILESGLNCKMCSSDFDSALNSQNSANELGPSVFNPISRASSSNGIPISRETSDGSIVDADANGGVPLHEDIDAVMRESVVGSLLPMVLVCMSTLLDKYGSKLVKVGVGRAAISLRNCLAKVSRILHRIPKEKLAVSETEMNVGPSSTSEIYESLHPYLPNTDSLTTISHPNCSRMTITFDSRTRTEASYDWVKFWKSPDRTQSCHPNVDKYSGRSEDKSWPGIGKCPPLVVEDCDTIYVEFRSDGSNEDWGWAFTVDVEFPLAAAPPRCHWLLELEKQLCYCGSLMSSSFISSVPWDAADVEEKHALWLEDKLFDYGLKFNDDSKLKGIATINVAFGLELASSAPANDCGDKAGIEAGGCVAENTEDEFYLSLINREVGSLGATLSKVMKSIVQEDMGHDPDINRAVDATCAALIKHNGLYNEANAIALGSIAGKDVSESLIKAWRAGQKMRHFFDVGDISVASAPGEYNSGGSVKKANEASVLLNDDELPSSAAVYRTHSAYKGASPEAVREISNEIVHKMLLLLRTGSKADLISRYPESSKKSWRVLKSLTRQQSYREQGARWKALVGEVKESFKFKEQLEFRRKRAQRGLNGGITMSERVLKFAQNKVDIKKLEILMKKRNVRATYRAEGLGLLDNLLENASSPLSILLLLDEFCKSLRSIRKSEQMHYRIHIRNGLEGCSTSESNMLTSRFANLLTVIVTLMASSFSKSRISSIDTEIRKQWKEVTLACLRACCIHYDIADHDTLEASSLLTVLERLLCAEDADIKLAAWSFLKFILPRCVVLFSSSNVDDLTDFGKKLVALLVNFLQSSCSAIVRNDSNRKLLRTKSANYLNNISVKGHVLCGGVTAFSRESYGLSHPHIPLMLNHSISVWLNPNSPHGLVKASDSDVVIAVSGSRVIRGPDWKNVCTDDGGDNQMGTVSSLSDKGLRVKVTWDSTKASNTYDYGFLVNGRPNYEVVVVDEKYGGQVFSKGAPAIMSEDQAMRTWSSFGLYMRHDGRLAYVAVSGEGEYVSNTTVDPIEPDKWSHVAVVHNERENNLWINGVKVASKIFPMHMLYPGVVPVKHTQIIESPHPYADGTDSKTPISFPGAIALSIVFDAQTKTESSYDYITFHKTDSQTDFWGERKYSGGRNGSNSNWPGVAGRPPLRIPASSCSMRFKSDNSNNDWGYRFTVTAEYPDNYDSGMKEMYESDSKCSGVLNNSPVYIGLTPEYVSNGISKYNKNGVMEGDICMLDVFEGSLSDEFVGKIYAEQKAKFTSTLECVDLLDEELCLRVLAMIKLIIPSLGGMDTDSQLFSGPIVANNLGNFHVISPLLSLINSAWSSAVKISALKICCGILPLTSPDVVSSAALSVGGLLHGGDFVTFLFRQCGRLLNGWSLFEDCRIHPATVNGDSRLSILCGYLDLLRALGATEEHSWSSSVAAVIESYSFRIPSILEELYNYKSNSRGGGDKFKDLHFEDLNDRKLSDSVNIVAAIVALFAGSRAVSAEGLFTGSRAQYSMGENIFEECTVLLPTWPPPAPSKRNPSKSCSKSDLAALKKAYDRAAEEHEAMWKGLSQYGDAVVIVLRSMPDTALVVPKRQLNCLHSSGASESFVDKSFNAFLQVHAGVVEEYFRLLIALDSVDNRLKRGPRIEEKDVVLTFESCHPYDKVREYKTVQIEGAKELIVEFDAQSRSMSNEDYVTFYKNSNHTSYFGQPRYYGKDSNKNWPGVGGKPALRIPKDSFDFLWSTNVESATSEHSTWGYKFTVRGHSVVKIDPPALPPMFSNMMLSFLKYNSLRSLKYTMDSNLWLVSPIIGVVAQLVNTALLPKPRSFTNEMHLKEGKKPLVFEGLHPYLDNACDYIPVFIKGAKKLSISFDDQTSTESGCDYIKFYKDASHTEIWGEKYSGGKGGSSSNWPGMSGRPPLEIPADSFLIHFKSDGSVNSWGWKLYVTVLEGSGADGDFFCSSTASCYATSCLYKLLIDGPAVSSNPIDLTSFPLLEAPIDEVILKSCNVANVRTCFNDVHCAVTTDAFGNEFVRGAVNGPTSSVMYIMNADDANEIIVREKPSLDSRVLQVVPAPSKEVGKVVDAVSSHLVFTQLERLHDAPVSSVESNGEESVCIDWVKVSFSFKGNECCGWTIRRENDVVYLKLHTALDNDNGKKAMDDKTVVVSDTFSYKTEDLVVLEDDPLTLLSGSSLQTTNSSSTSAAVHPMCEVLDAAPGECGTSRVHMLPPPPVQSVISGQLEVLPNSVMDAETYSSILLAQDCIGGLMENWPADVPFTLDVFDGNPENMLLFIEEIYRRHSESDRVGFEDENLILRSLKNRILDILPSCKLNDVEYINNNKLAIHLINYCADILSQQTVTKRKLTPFKALHSIIETKHNYDDNADDHWTLSVPGALFLKITFDPRSSTEDGCDYCNIYKDSRKEAKWNNCPYTGSGRSKVWAGVGNEPACIVTGDTCIVHFHSDSSNNDWGFLLNCFAIMEGPSDEEMAAAADEDDGTSEAMKINLACWLLGFMFQHYSGQVIESINSAGKLLYSSSMFEALTNCVITPVASQKICVVELIIGLLESLNDASNSMVLSRNALDSLIRLKKAVIETADTLYTVETCQLKKNSSTMHYSQLLQAYVQASVLSVSSSKCKISFDGGILGGVDKERRLKWLDSGKESKVTVCGDFSRILNTVGDDAACGSDCGWDQLQSSVARECKITTNECFGPDDSNQILHYRVCFDRHLSDCVSPADNIVLGFCSDHASLGWYVQSNTIVLCWSGGENGKANVNLTAMTNYCPALESGDVLSIEIDCQHDNILWYRNAVPLFCHSIGGKDAEYRLPVDWEQMFSGIIRGVSIVPCVGDSVMLVDNFFEIPRAIENSASAAVKHVDVLPLCKRHHECQRVTGIGPTYGSHSTVICDECSRRHLQRDGKAYYHCASCRYDLCENCKPVGVGRLPPSKVEPNKEKRQKITGQLALPEWFGPVKDTLSLLSAISSRNISKSILESDLLSSISDSHTATVETVHPYDGIPFSESIVIPGAEKLLISIDPMSFGDDCVLEVYDGLGVGEVDPSIASVPGSLLRRFTSIPVGYGGAEVKNIEVGDWVVRGAAWEWGNEDGGPGSWGKVTEIRTWKGNVGSGVKVKWNKNGRIGLYRWRYEDGRSDVRVVKCSLMSTLPIHTTSNAVRIDYRSNGSSASVNCDSNVSLPKWVGAARFGGINLSKIDIAQCDSELEIESNCTVESWIKISNDVATSVAAVSSGKVYLPLISRKLYLDDEVPCKMFNLGFNYCNGVGLKAVFQCCGPDLVQVPEVESNTTLDTIPLGKWFHFAMVIKEGSLKYYINGSVIHTGSIPCTLGLPMGAPIEIGYESQLVNGVENPLVTKYFDGHLYDFRVWNVNRTTDEILKFKDNELLLPAAGLQINLMKNEEALVANGGQLLVNRVNHVSMQNVLNIQNITWDANVENCKLPVGSVFGMKVLVKPVFSIASVMDDRKLADNLRTLMKTYNAGLLKHDIALVKYVDEIAVQKNYTLDQVLLLKWEDIAPNAPDLIRLPVLKELIELGGPASKASNTFLEETKEEVDVIEEKESDPGDRQLSGLSQSGISIVEIRFKMLQSLNRAVSAALRFIDMSTVDNPTTLSALLSSCRGVVFHVTKIPVWTQLLNASEKKGSDQFDLKLSRMKASKFARSDQVDNDARYMCFSQAFRVMHVMPPSNFRKSCKLYNVIFMGEYSHDAGGPYRESFAFYAMELQSPSLPLLIKTPNGRHAVGQNRDKFVLNPGATTALHMEMFSFMGKLMGIAIRSKEYMAVSIAPIIWKLMVGEVPTTDDLESIDSAHQKSIRAIKNIDQHGIDAEMFSYTFFETFTTLSIDDQTVELVPHGAEKEVTFENRHEFCDCVDNYRLHSFDKQVAAVRAGLAQIVPLKMLSLFTWDQLEMMVCGSSEIDVDLLEANTEYSSCSRSDEHIIYFWDALRSFNTEEKSALIRFTWGRSRLPLNSDGFSQKFKLQSFNRSPPDQYLPVAHTCFFSLELPKYSSIEIMKEKLRYAIFNCAAIDGDDTSMGIMAAGLGLDDEDEE